MHHFICRIHLLSESLSSHFSFKAYQVETLQLVYSFYSLSLTYIYKITDGRSVAAKILASVYLADKDMRRSFCGELSLLTLKHRYK